MYADLKTFITSRPEQRVLTAQKEEERDHPKLNIVMSMSKLEDKSNEDIRRLIEHRFDKLEGLQGNGDHWVCQKERLREELIKKANMSFRACSFYHLMKLAISGNAAVCQSDA